MKWTRVSLFICPSFAKFFRFFLKECISALCPIFLSFFSFFDVADALTGEFDLNDEQVNARHRTGYKIFLNHVNTAANALVNSEKLLKIKRGWIINPDQFEDITPDDMSSSGEDTPSPEVVMERSYQEIQNNLEAELLNKIKDNPPDFLSSLFLTFLLKWGTVVHEQTLKS